MATIAPLFILAWLAQTPASPPPAQPIACEFRVFDGADEVTRETRVRVYVNGQKENGVPADAAGRVPLGPGLYDVQLIRERNGQVTAIRWIEHLLVMRYPDEEGGHLEVANFKPQYGALELRTADAAADTAEAFAPGDRTHPIASSKAGNGYLLLVVPAGRYDVRVRPTGSTAPGTWLTDVDVPAERTRLRTLTAATTPRF